MMLGMDVLPPPSALGLPEKFEQWRDGQVEALSSALDTDKRVSLLLMPTGFGKSLVYVAAAILSRTPAVLLTSTKGLQSQLLYDFGDTGLVDVRGAANYPCAALQDGRFGVRRDAGCDEGPCHAGAACALKKDGCSYYDAVTRARGSRLVVTNYSYWLAVSQYGGGLGYDPMAQRREKRDMGAEVSRGLLILDEAHAVPDELAGFLAIQFDGYDLEHILQSRTRPPMEFEAAREWARDRLVYVQSEIEVNSLEGVDQTPQWGKVKYVRRLKAAETELKKIIGAEGTWIVSPYGRDNRGVRFDPVDVAPYREVLFRGARKVIMVSATASRKTAKMLGVDDGDLHYQEYQSGFPVKRRPVYPVPCVRMRYDMEQGQLDYWVATIDNVLRGRGDRKGIIHTVSYARRDYLLEHSQHRDWMHTHDSRDVAVKVERFKRADPPAVMVSPSLVTGWDFPYQACEYQIICKVPFPNSSDPVVKARQKHDKDYGPYVAMVNLVQAAGRGFRAEDDLCEIFIVDDNWFWFLRKYRDFAPSWFTQAIRSVTTIPRPPDRLAKQQKEE